MLMPPKKNDTGSISEGIRRVDDALPAGIDRRAFFKTAAVGMGISLAGCLGDDDENGDGGSDGDDGSDGSDGDGSSDGGDGGDESLQKDLGFRIAVDPSPNYAIAYAAQSEGFWEDQGIDPLEVQGGQGSGDTARRVATNEDPIALSAVTPQMLGIAQDDYDILQVGMTKFRAQSGLIYREDRIDDPFDPDDLAGATITAPDTLDEQMFEIFRQGIGAPDNVEVEYAEGATAASMLDQGDIDAIWDSINDYASLSENLDHDLGFAPLYAVEPIAGYAMIVNGSWVEETENGTEYVKRVVQGYSEAAKWVLLNPEDALDMMIEEVQAIETQSRESNLQAMAAGVAAVNHADQVKENGFGYIDQEVMQNTFDLLGDTYLEEGDEVPNVEDVIFQEVVEDIELAQFSDEEWEQVEEFSGEFDDFYE